MTDDSFEIICDRCRAAVPSDAETCPECGNVLIATPERPRATAISPPVYPVSLDAVMPEAFEPQLDEYRHLLRDPAPSMTRASYGGFWIRVCATLIDSVLIFAVVFTLAYVGEDVLASVAYAASFFLYYPLMEASAQGTIGKIMCGLAVTDTDGNPISVWRAYGRLVGRILCWLTAGLGYLLVAFTPRKQGLHDFVAGTLVLHRGLY